MGLTIILLFAAFFAVGCAAFVITWFATRGGKSTWLRHLIRAMVFAIAFTPTIVPAPQLHGSLPMPAVWFLAAIVSTEDFGKRVNLIYGGIPILLVALLYWSIANLISYLARKYPAEE